MSNDSDDVARLERWLWKKAQYIGYRHPRWVRDDVVSEAALAGLERIRRGDTNRCWIEKTMRRAASTHRRKLSKTIPMSRLRFPDELDALSEADRIDLAVDGAKFATVRPRSEGDDAALAFEFGLTDQERAFVQARHVLGTQGQAGSIERVAEHMEITVARAEVIRSGLKKKVVG